MRRRNWVPVILFALLLTACSSTTFVYNRLDFFIPWYVGKYVDLDRAQEEQLDALLVPFLQWHRQDELPAYSNWLATVREGLKAPLDVAQLRAWGEQTQAAWDRVELRGLDWMIAIGENLSDAQVAAFIAELRETQAEYEDEDLSRDNDQYREEARENLEDQLEDFLGQINDAQESMLDSAVAQLWRADRTWLAERARWLDRLEQILQRQPGWQEELRRAVIERESFNSAEYLATYEHNSTVLYAVIAEVINSRSERQDRHLQRKLDGLQRDLARLAAPAGEPGAAGS
ncbi:DUF6279 family lipoprotein [Haliea sp. E17]|uniref:DUF6279 family lipoprotein n=1 Tax=Haliea sp. E17 TaxID=3401576 RepID=UPI003AAD8274